MKVLKLHFKFWSISKGWSVNTGQITVSCEAL